MPHADLEERRKCKRESKARMREKRREEYRSVAPAFNIVERKRKPIVHQYNLCLLYTSPSPRDGLLSRMPSSA